MEETALQTAPGLVFTGRRVKHGRWSSVPAPPEHPTRGTRLLTNPFPDVSGKESAFPLAAAVGEVDEPAVRLGLRRVNGAHQAFEVDG